MNIHQEQINSLLRTVLIFVGALLTTGGVHHFFGHEIDTPYWEQITGVIFALVSIYWSITTKTVDIEKMQGLVRQVIAFICGILASKGLINAQTITAIVGFSGALLTWVQAGLSRKKAKDISTGKIDVQYLKGVK